MVTGTKVAIGFLEMELALKTRSFGDDTEENCSENKLSDRKMFLQLPEERPLIRRSTSPTIVVPIPDTEARYGLCFKLFFQIIQITINVLLFPLNIFLHISNNN